MSPCRIRTCAAACLCALLWTPQACALICGPVAHTRYVGDVASDSQCTDSTIQSAIDNATCPGTVIVVTSELTYAGQSITVDKAVSIVGSTDICNPPPVVCDPDTGCGSSGPPAKVAIGGNGVNPVFHVTASGSVGFKNLSISGGAGAPFGLDDGGGIGILGDATHVALANVELHDNNSHYGGGLSFHGDGSLSLDGVSIHDNDASIFGGGINVFSSGAGHVDVTIVNDASVPTLVFDNTSDNTGGGLYIAGNVHLTAVDASAVIQLNQAGQSGGGIAIANGAVADIGLVGHAIDNNSSALGGGIAVFAGSTSNSVVRLFNLIGADPLTLSYNSATQDGGGIYLFQASAGAHATACLFDVDLDQNSATQGGAAIWVGSNDRLLVNPVSDSECDPATVAALGARPGAYGGTTLYGNFALDDNNQTTDAAVIDIHGAGAQVLAQRLQLDQNGGGYAIHAAFAGGADLHFSQCLIDHNLSVHELVDLQGAPASFDGCTFAGNNIGAGTVFAFDSGLSLTRSIVATADEWQTWNPAASANLVARYLVLSGQHLDTDDTVIYADPVFVDPNDGDFQLQDESPAVDYAPAGNESGPADLGHRPREVDKASVVNRFGLRDLGAFEISPACFQFDTVFCDGFGAQ
ncbi:MAG TPA: hypothetical protein VFG73_04895 [Rhodanobacteraceae bacterium]|nr:hypothetical protein [Rhodanobacteraceae bacterium]